MADEIKIANGGFDEAQALEYYNKAQQNQQKIEQIKNDFQTSPEQDEFVKSENKTAKTAGVIGGLIATAAVIVGAICLKKGGKALEGKDASLKEKLEAGWKELRGKVEKDGKKAADETNKKEDAPKPEETKKEEPKKEEPKTEEKKAEESSEVDKKPESEEVNPEVKPETEEVIETPVAEETPLVEAEDPLAEASERVVNDDIFAELDPQPISENVVDPLAPKELSTGDIIQYRHKLDENGNKVLDSERKPIIEVANKDELEKIVTLEDGKTYEQYVDKWNNLQRYNTSLFTKTHIEYKGVDESQYTKVVTNRLTGKETKTVCNPENNDYYILVSNRNGRGRRFIRLDADGNVLETRTPKIVKKRARNFVDKKNGIKVEESIRQVSDGDEYMIRTFTDLDDNKLLQEITDYGGEKLDWVDVYKKDENGYSVMDYVLSEFDKNNVPSKIQYRTNDGLSETQDFTGEYKPLKAKENKLASFFNRFKDIED